MIFQEELIKSLAANSASTAIEHNGRQVSYAGVSRIAGKVTAFLLNLQLEKETVVGVQLHDRTALICAMIGVMNARCVVVPIDGALPANRLAAMVQELNLQHVITSAGSPNVITSAASLKNYFIEDIVDQISDADVATIRYPAFEPNDSLYIYFTSGSTGTPKGIIGKNCSLLQFLRWELAAFGINEQSRFSQFISPYFDAFLRDVFAPLLAGGTVCIPPTEKDFFTPEKMIAWVDENRIELIHCVPSVFRIMNNGALSADNFKHLRYILMSGEKIIPAELKRWYDVFGPRIQLINLYGPTETTMVRSMYRIRPEDASQSRIPVGRPINDTEFLIAKEDMKPCGKLIPGDLYIITNYTTKGYLNLPELTKEKFITLHEGTPQETIAFKTGDKARLLADGNFDLIGREDRQVKLRGVRIELDEVENVLTRSQLVKQAVVVMNSDEQGNESLVAFVIGNNPAADLKDLLNQYLQAHLPEYMLPSGIVEVTEYPLLSNGKINYKALLGNLAAVPMVAPANAMEERILGIWKEILGDKPISTRESFHSMGGNSISIMRLIGKIYKEFNVRISLNDLFNNLTIQLQAALIERSSGDNLMIINKAEQKPAYNLSSAQERIYYNYEMNRSGTAFNLPMAWEMNDDIPAEKIEGILKALIARHESLRTEFRFVNGKLVQVVKEEVEFAVEEINGREENVQAAVAEFIRPFELDKAPLFRCGIIAGKGRKVLVLDVHHIVCDGMSQVILLTDFLSLYKGEALKPLRIQYKDYAEWEYNFKTTDEYIAHREFWLKSFEGEVPKLELPVTSVQLNRPPGQGGNLLLSINQKTMKPVLDLLKEEGITSFSGLISIYFMFLSQLTGQEDIVVGINSTGRMQDEVEGVVGMFVKTLPVRRSLSSDVPFRQFANDMHKYLVQATSRQIYDLADMLSELNNNRPVPVKSLFEAMFVFLDFEETKSRANNDGFYNYEFENATSKYPLTLFAREVDGAFNFRLEYATAYFTREDVEMLAAQFTSLVERIAQNADATTGEYIGIGSNGSNFAEEENISFNF